MAIFVILVSKSGPGPLLATKTVKGGPLTGQLKIPIQGPLKSQKMAEIGDFTDF